MLKWKKKSFFFFTLLTAMKLMLELLNGIIGISIGSL